jgi:hypothetical protein
MNLENERNNSSFTQKTLFMESFEHVLMIQVMEDGARALDSLSVQMLHHACRRAILICESKYTPL